MKKICAMIAAAGQSQRMGSPKALMPIFGRPAATYLADMMLCLNAEQIFITLPVELLLNDGLGPSAQKLTTLPNVHAHLGLAGSIKTVVQNLKSRCQGLFIQPVDAPFLPAQLLTLMRSLLEKADSKPLILVPHYLSGAAHPIYCSSHFFAELVAMGPGRSLRDVIKLNKKFVSQVYFPSSRILLNLNTPAELWAWNHVHANFKRQTAV